MATSKTATPAPKNETEHEVVLAVKFKTNGTHSAMDVAKDMRQVLASYWAIPAHSPVIDTTLDGKKLARKFGPKTRAKKETETPKKPAVKKAAPKRTTARKTTTRARRTRATAAKR